ncbi:MAG TPA: phosphatidylserine decarboxylase family protein [Bacteroidia bacterium]|nr:phosphatidylserine decarboxylase family protein [Bacteroidia bacterium]HNT80108.1 phosphatidylserine decarboxylase family protein [Bacteroidia bacterium]
MTIHKEGFKIIAIAFVIWFLVNAIVFLSFPNVGWSIIISLTLTTVMLFLIVQFFRYPKRNITRDDNAIIAPCDGKVVVIEKVIENEFYKEKRLQVSIFMSPLNVHINWYPISGRIAYLKYHMGKYLVAWHPKSSTENERTSIVIQKERYSVLVRQIAGTVARRIVYYPHEGDKVKQGAQLGFIKFGSRVDLMLPLDAQINVSNGEKTKGGVTVIARMPN